MSLETVLTRLSANLSGCMATGLNEAQTSQIIVLPVFQALGYDIWNPYEVVAEEHSGDGSGAYRPDFTVKLDGKARFIVEVKALNRDFDINHIAQAVGYVNTLGHRWAILTNGRAWKFFDNSVLKPAADKLALTVDVSDTRARHYLMNLLGRRVWEQSGAEDNLAQAVAEVDADIKKRLDLDKIETKLRQELREGFAANAKGLAKAIELTLEPNERELAEEEFEEIAKRLFGGSSETQTKTLLPKTPTRSASTQSSDDVITAIRQGIEISQAFRRHRQRTEVELEAHLQNQRLEVNGWRDLNAGIAEAMLVLGYRDYLASRNVLNQSRDERRKSDGSTYPLSGYRELSNGEFLFLHASAETHKQRIRQMLTELGVADQTLKIIYKGNTTVLP